MSAELMLAKLENTNLKDRIELLEKQLASANTELANKLSGEQPTPSTSRVFTPDNMTPDEKKALLIGTAEARTFIRRIWKVAERVRAIHPEWKYDMRNGKLYIVFGTTDVYGSNNPNEYGVKLSCRGSTFTVYTTFGYLKTDGMIKHVDVEKSEVVEKIESLVSVWTERLASENMELTGMERCANLVGSRLKSPLSELIEFLRERNIDVFRCEMARSTK